MKQERLISVVMPVYNGGKYLREAIDSILNQTYQNFEFLIINDGSTDETDEIIRSYTDARIVYLQNDKNRGLVYTLNYGISVAKGEYIARMDADDISESIRFERQIEVFLNDPEIGLCGTWAKVIGSNLLLKVESDYEEIKCKLLFTNQFVHSSVIFRKEHLDKFGLFYEEKNFPAEDYALWINTSEKIKMFNLRECLLQYRVHPSQISTASSLRQKQRTNALQIQQITTFLNYEPSEDEKNTHVLLTNFDQAFPDSRSIRSIHQWLVKLKSLNNRKEYYQQPIFEKCIADFFASRLLFQNYRNNNPSFLVSFYLFYFRHQYRFGLIFHLKFIMKCLIFYNPQRPLWRKQSFQ